MCLPKSAIICTTHGICRNCHESHTKKQKVIVVVCNFQTGATLLVTLFIGSVRAMNEDGLEVSESRFPIKLSRSAPVEGPPEEVVRSHGLHPRPPHHHAAPHHLHHAHPTPKYTHHPPTPTPYAPVTPKVTQTFSPQTHNRLHHINTVIQQSLQYTQLFYNKP